MKKALFLAVALAFCAAAMAQQYKWVDKDGKVQYGDVPPPGVKATPLRPPSGAGAPAPAAKTGDPKAAAKKSGPLSVAEQEAEFRKRQNESQKEQEKQAEAGKEAAQKKENCARAQEHSRSLESGQRITRTEAGGERRNLEDAEIATEKSKARQAVQQWCN